MGKLADPASTTSNVNHPKTLTRKHKRNSEPEIIIATLNAQTLRTCDREEELDNALKEIKFDVLGLSEVRRMGESIIEKENGDLLFHIGTTTPGQKGVGFIVKRDLKHMVMELTGISERIAVLKLATRNSPVTIIQVYAPTEASSEDELENFYKSLDNALEKFKSPTNLIIGDFNGKVGSRSHEDEEPVGPHGFGRRNDRGDGLVQFAQEHRLKIANTFFRKNPQNRWTWRSPNGSTKNEIDYILSNRQNSISDIQVVTNLKFSTDHRMVKATLKLEKRRRWNKHSKPSIDNEEYKRQMQNRMAQTDFSTGKTPQELYDSLEHCILQSYEDTQKADKAKKHKGKLSEETITLIKRRSELYLTRDDSERNKEEYARIDKLTKREIRKDIRNHRASSTRQILES